MKHARKLPRNSTRSADDYPRMTQSCDEFRTALSARIDGEDPGIPPARLDGHLVACSACRAWLTAAEQVTRTVRVQPVEVPDLTARILAAVAADTPDRARSRRRMLQIALAVSAVIQLVLALPVLFAPAMDLHTSREAASFDIALAVGFALAAWRPERARAFVPVAFVLAACLAVTSAFDIRGGAVLLAHEISHLAALAQAGLLLALSRTTGQGKPGSGRRREAITA